jgi:leucyl-tRNA synthetase
LVTDHVHHGSHAALDPGALNNAQKALRRKTHETIAKVGDDYGRRQTFNTAIAAVMELCNEISKHQGNEDQDLAVTHEALRAALLMLNPVVPHITYRLWHLLVGDDILDAPWPSVDESALVRDELEIVVQVNGKVRAKISVPANADKAALEAAALAEENVQRFIDGNTIRKVIVVPGKLVNVVAN